MIPASFSSIHAVLVGVAAMLGGPADFILRLRTEI